MNIQILPNWFKKIALVLFFVFSLLSGADSFIEGYNSYECRDCEKIEQVSYFKDAWGENTLHIFAILAYVFLISYLLCKEKVEDDYIKLLRLESFQLSFLLIVCVSFLFYLFKVNFMRNVDDTFALFLLLYLSIFAIKKRM